jgi:hypothetical protein
VKIAYILRHNLTLNDGIVKKILDQVTMWQLLGHKVEIYCLTKKIGSTILEKAKQYEYKNIFDLLFVCNEKLLKDIDTFNPDIVYMRYTFWNKTFYKILKKYKVIVELNSLDLPELLLNLKKKKGIKEIVYYLLFKLLRNNVLSNVDGIVSVTYEIMEHPIYKKFNKKSVCVPNSILLNRYEVNKIENNKNEKISLFFMGTPNQPWHGIDFIVKMAENLPQYNFHIVGMKGDNRKNLFWHGYLKKEEYLEILKKCHICIGTLALYRKNMKEACPLKVREYLAYGYPIIIGYEDTSLKNKFLPDWVLKIDTKYELDYDKIKNFIEKNKNKVINHDIVNFIDSQIVEKKRINFIEKILKGEDDENDKIEKNII